MQSNILLIAPQSSSTTLVRALHKIANISCKHTSYFRGALEHLQTEEFSVILLDKNLLSARPSASEAVFQRAGTAQVLEFDSKRLDISRVLLEVRTAMNRRAHYQWRAYETARQLLAAEFRSNVSVLVTESELMVQSVSRLEARRMRKIARLAGDLRDRLEAV
jgi:hypothetical protein